MDDLLYGIVIGFALTLGGWLAGCWFTRQALVDPWQLQSKLMRISDQFTPPIPTLTKEVVLYAALIFEEAGEMAETMRQVIADAPALDQYPLSERSLQLEDHFSRMSNQLKIGSKRIKDELVSMGQFASPIPRGQAQALLDDASDIVVVTAGFSLASGLPGASGYSEVQRSNHSKANPLTGLIEKDASGKWIKGSNYTPPDLDGVIARQIDSYAQR